MLGAIVEGVPAGLALTEDDLAVDLARRQRGYGRGARQAIEQDRARILSGVRHGRTLGSPILLEVDNRDWANWTRVMQVGPLSDEEAAELAALAEEGNKRATPITAVRPGHADLAALAQVRLQRRAQRARALLGARDRGAGGRGRRRPRVPARAGDRGLVVHRRGRRRGRGPGERHARPRRGRRLAAALPGPGRRGGDDRPDRRGPIERRHGRRRVRGRRPRRADRPRQLRPLGPAPGRGAGGGRDEHQHRQGRRDRARVRADPPLRIAGPRRHRRPARRRDVDPPDQQRRRSHRRRDERRADRRPRRRQADLDARPAAADGRPRDRRVAGQGALRAERHLRGAGRRRHRRGDGDADACRLRAREDRRRLHGRGARQPRAVPGEDRPGPGGAGRGLAGGRARRPRHRRHTTSPTAPAGTTERPVDVVLVGLPGSGKTAVGRRVAGRHGARVHRPRRPDREGRRASPSPRSSRPTARRGSGGSSARPCWRWAPRMPSPASGG